jgi:hypothetical protein
VAALPGFLVFAAGFLLLFALLARHGALARSKQIGALRDLAAGRRGARGRTLLLLAIGALVAGTCGTFAGVTAGDAARARRCRAACEARGYRAGAIRGSTERDPANPRRHRFVACACEGGPAPDPLELDSKSL